VAAYGQRAFNAGFPAMNSIGRPSQPDPEEPFAVRRPEWQASAVELPLADFR
jgi:hypothetical protein